METIIQRQAVSLNVNVKKYMPMINFVLKARSKDKNRSQLRYLKIDETGFCCTDGRRLHLCTDLSILPNGLSAGLWDVIVSTNNITFIPVDETFPNYKDIIPVDNTVHLTLNFNDESQSLSIAVSKIIKALNNKFTVNYEYLKDICNVNWDITFHKSSGAMKFISNDMLVLIMPI